MWVPFSGHNAQRRQSVGAPLVGALRGLLWRPNLDAIALFSLPLRAPSSGLKKGVPCPFAPLRGQKRFSSRPFAPLRGQKRCSPCPSAALGRSPRPFAPLRGQKVFSGVGQKVLPLPFSAPLRGPPWTKKGFLRAPSRPFADKKGVLPAPSRAILASELRCDCPDLRPHFTGKISPHVRQFTPA